MPLLVGYHFLEALNSRDSLIQLEDPLWLLSNQIRPDPFVEPWMRSKHGLHLAPELVRRYRSIWLDYQDIGRWILEERVGTLIRLFLNHLILLPHCLGLLTLCFQFTLLTNRFISR